MDLTIIFPLLIFTMIAAISMAAQDKVQHHFTTSVFARLGPWWNPKESWRLKWRNGDPAQGERFWGSSTVLVFVTDFWHFAKWVMLKAMFLAMVWGAYGVWWKRGVAFIVLHGAFSLCFEVWFRWLFHKQTVAHRNKLL
jgi:hypothetical protein